MFSFAVALFVGLMVPGGSAAERTAGFTVSPAQLSLTLNSETLSQSATVTIENSYNTELQLIAELQAIDESGVRLVPAGPVDEALASALKISTTDISIPAHSTYQLEIHLIDHIQLADGGHYASLVLSQRPGAEGSSTFRPAVAVNVFIIKNQNVRTDLQLTDLTTNRTIFSLPSSASVVFKNLGNTHVVPRGSISIYDDQTLIGKAIVNTDSRVVLPDRQAEFKTTFEMYSRLLLPRKLRMQTMYRIDTSDVQLMQEQTFWYVPVVDIIAMLGILVIIWWRRRQLGRFLRKLKIAGTGRRQKRQTKATGSTTRILGRTVIRTHRAAALRSTRTKVSKSLGLYVVPEAKRIPAQKSIPVTIVEEPVTPPPSPRPVSPPKPATSVKPRMPRKTSAESAAPPKKPAKKAAKSTTKKSVAKTISPKKKTAAAKPSVSSKSRAAKTTRKKTS